jgi:phosphoribosylformylglycinamidine synthase I
MFGIIVFPGSNCDHDCYHALKHVLGTPARFIWHKETSIGKDVRVVVLPGGFSHGDYLRAGALARVSPVINPLREFAADGGLVLGICNGFQILLEAGLLPGAMLRNKNLRFICKNIRVKVTNADTPFTRNFKEGQVLTLPIAHAEGNYFADKTDVENLTRFNRIALTYCNEQGDVTVDANPNGALLNVAGIINEKGNVLGMMPHPERCCEEILGNTDGRKIFESIIASLSD